VTNLVNVRRGDALSDAACRRGHPRNEANLGILPSGIRYCKECRRQSAARSRAVKSAPTTRAA
jgi:hypothetical protein